MDSKEKAPAAATSQNHWASDAGTPFQREAEMPPPPYSEGSLTVPTETASSYDSTFSGTFSSNRTLDSNTSAARLEKPVVIPATMPKLGSPFLRAYPPSVEAFHISRELFLKFIDDLNRVAVASPPIQVLGLAGSLVSFVPLHTAQIVGGAVNAAATIGTVAVSKGRTEMFLRDANRTIFGPRGLKVEIAKVEVVAKIANMPILNEKNKIDKHTPLLQPLDELALDSDLSGQERRLRALQPWIASLDLAPLPEISTPDNFLSKLHAGASERQRQKGEKKLLKERQKAQKESDKASKVDREMEKEMKKLDKEEDKARRKEADDQHKLNKELEKIEKERNKVLKEHAKELDKVQEDKIKDDKEEEGIRKILWLMIRNLDADSGQGQNPDVDLDGQEASRMM